MAVLVIGGAGYIGSHTALALKRRGYEPIIYDNLSAGHASLAQGFELVVGDISDTIKLAPLLQRVDAVMHFAARIDFRSNAAAEPFFLEANPLAGLHPHHSDLPILAAQNGVPYIELIGMILDAGLARYGLARSIQGRSRRRA